MDILLPRVQHALDKAGIAYEVLACDPALADTATFCEHYGFEEEQSANTIVVAGKADPMLYACCIVLATTKLDVNKAVCKQMRVKRASFAAADVTRELTGMEIGGVAPFGLPGSMPVYIDSAVLAQTKVVMGGGNRTSKVLLDPAELRKLPGVQIVDGLAKPKE